MTDPRKKGSPLAVLPGGLRAAHPAEKARRAARTKAYALGAERVRKQDGALESNVLPPLEDTEAQFGLVGAIEPPYIPEAMLQIVEASSTLPQSIAALEVNVESFGYRLEPVINPDHDDADDKIRSILIIEKGVASGWQATYIGGGKTNLDPTPEEIAERKARIRAEMAVEKARIEAFFQGSVIGSTLTQLRCGKRRDQEATGNAYWEMIRDPRGVPSLFVHVPSKSVRLMPLDAAPTEVSVPRRMNAITYGSQLIRKRFRRFVQVMETQTTFFKEFGDRRVMSRATGAYYPDLDSLLRDEPEGVPATEIWHHPLHVGHGPYGMVRWTGAILAVLGTTAAEEVNYLYFDNKSVPPMALMIANAHLKKGVKQQIEDYIENQLKGRQNFHKLLVIEAEAFGTPGTHSSNVRMHLMPLTSAQQRDGLFLQYIESNTDRVGQAFRLPRILRGDVRDVNRAATEAALRFTEHQVFQPEREIFDGDVNERLFPEMGWRYWKFTSNSPIASDPQTMSTMVQGLTVAGILTPAEAREMLEDVLNQNLQRIDRDWANQPLTLTISELAHPPKNAGPSDTNDLGHGNDPNADPTQTPSENVEGARQPQVRTDLSADRTAWEMLKAAGYEVPPAYRDMGVEVVKVPTDLLMSWLEPNDPPASSKPKRPRPGRPRKPTPT